LIVNGQEKKVEIVSFVKVFEEWTKINHQVQFTCTTKGIPILMESIDFNNHYDLHNYLYKFLGVSITKSSSVNPVLKILMRGDNHTIVIVDGFHCDASILNRLITSDIESITVASSIAASNYLRNR
jgi:hypothetical protein